MLWGLLRTQFVATLTYKALWSAVSRVLFLIFGAFHLLRMCLCIAAAVCLKGRSVLDLRERTEEPDCLRDPALGTHEFVILDNGMTLHYVSAGSRHNSLVILLHGFPDIWYTWHKQILELKKKYCVGLHCFVEGERVLVADHLIVIGVGGFTGEATDIVPLCAQTSNLFGEPHQIYFKLKNLSSEPEVEKGNCLCVAGLSERVVAPDMRGYGQSSRPSSAEEYQLCYLVEDISGLIQSLERNRVILVGHDWGAVVSWCFANKYPDAVDKLVVVNGGHPEALRQLLKTSPMQMLKSSYVVAFRCPKIPELWLTVDDFAEMKHLHNHCDDVEEVTSVRQYAFSKPGAMTAAINYYRATYSKERQLKNFQYRRLNVPALLLWGSRDPYGTTQVAELSRRYSSKVTVQFLQDCGHWPHQENAPVVNQALEAFLGTSASFDSARRARLKCCRSSL